MHQNKHNARLSKYYALIDTIACDDDCDHSEDLHFAAYSHIYLTKRFLCTFIRLAAFISSM